MLARIEGYIPYGTFGDFVHKVPKKHSMITDFINGCNDFSNSAILCGFNKTRVSLNQKIRTWNKREGKLPVIGERVICLKNNAQAKRCPIYNGICGTVKEIVDHIDYAYTVVSIDGEDKNYVGKISRNIFNNPSPDMNSEWIYDTVIDQGDDVDNIKRFLKNKNTKTVKKYLDCYDFGYCMTVHKSQGSEWERVMVIEQPCQHWSGELWNRWLYTSVTRSKKELLIVR
jgi:exodeoxyribonuclease-5